MARRILITGGNSGIGWEMARSLTSQGDHVVIASRALAKSQAAADSIRAEQPQAHIEAMALDLSLFEDIDRFAEQIRERMPVIDVLILNAGLYTHGTRALDNGLEAMIGVMHVGHFRLTQKLLGAVETAEAGRIVVTASVAHRVGRIREKTFTRPSAHWLAVQAYGQAKLANILFTRELARRLANTSVTINCFHPGAVATGIWAELPGPLQKLLDRVLVTPAQGADTGVWLATSDDAAGISGEYFTNRKITSTSRAANDLQSAAALWQATENLMRRA